MLHFTFIPPPAMHTPANKLSGNCHGRSVELHYRYINEPNNDRHIHDLEIRINGDVVNEQLGIDRWMEKSSPGPAQLEFIHPDRPCFMVEHSKGIYLVNLAEETTRFIPYSMYRFEQAWFYQEQLVLLESSGFCLYHLDKHRTYLWDTKDFTDRHIVLDLRFDNGQVHVLVKNLTQQRVHLQLFDKELSKNPECLLLADLLPDTSFTNKLRHQRDSHFTQLNDFRFPAIIDSYQPVDRGKDNCLKGLITELGSIQPYGDGFLRIDSYDYIGLDL